MNILFDNIKQYVADKCYDFKTLEFDFNGYGDYKKVIYNVTKVEKKYNKSIINKLKNKNKLFVYESIVDDVRNEYGAEIIGDNNVLSLDTYSKALTTDITVPALNYTQDNIPDFDFTVPEGTKLKCTTLLRNEFIKDIIFPGRENGKLADVKCSLYFTNCSYELYSKFGHDYRHISYNEENNDFTAFGLTSKKLKEKIKGIVENGIQTPIIFELYGTNLFPIYGRVEWFTALYLKLPIIPVCVITAAPKFSIDNLYPETEMTVEKLNEFLSPYVAVYGDAKRKTGYVRNIG